MQLRPGRTEDVCAGGTAVVELVVVPVINRGGCWIGKRPLRCGKTVFFEASECYLGKRHVTHALGRWQLAIALNSHILIHQAPDLALHIGEEPAVLRQEQRAGQEYGGDFPQKFEWTFTSI